MTDADNEIDPDEENGIDTKLRQQLSRRGA